ncbi:MAG: hypothetical protein D6808_01180 [Candidatus Dadabacteria bacterium]|nr:MAG: hypothetical protein D6808_01180 [Candidatus Dadabacteria bacterium]
MKFILVTVGFIWILAPAAFAGELYYELRTYGSSKTILTVEGSDASMLEVIPESGGKIIRVSGTNVHFIPKSEYLPKGMLKKVVQMRRGQVTDLVISFNQSVSFSAFPEGDVLKVSMASRKRNFKSNRSEAETVAKVLAVGSSYSTPLGSALGIGALLLELPLAVLSGDLSVGWVAQNKKKSKSVHSLQESAGKDEKSCDELRKLVEDLTQELLKQEMKKGLSDGSLK